uniref:DDE-type integrase/transposase/recombinase n=1 Tax=Wolbachia endosymbiont of Nilaparvata lugens TaxID=357143 RepID=UPI00397D06C7
MKTKDGWLYLAAIIDLYSRMVVGWSMSSTIAKRLVIDALLMAVDRRKPVKICYSIAIKVHNIPLKIINFC